MCGYCHGCLTDAAHHGLLTRYAGLAAPGYIRVVARFVLIFALVVAWLYTLIDCIRTPRSEVRLLPKGVWLLLMFLVPLLANGLYWLLGRSTTQESGGSSGRGARRSPKAPDDDPEFLRRVAEQAWRERMEKRRRQDRKDGRNDSSGPEGEPRPA
jgi:hypothetical protein